jgi:uncharacterized protein (DUF1499 family)
MRPGARARRILNLAWALLLGGCTGPPDRPASMGTLPACGWLPNCVNTQSGEGVHAAEPIRADAEEWKALKAWLAEQEDWDIRIEEERFVQAVVKTPVMRFRDDVQLLFIPEQQLIHVRSSSRLGIGDLGTNAQRVELLRSRVGRQGHVWSGDRSDGSK